MSGTGAYDRRGQRYVTWREMAAQQAARQALEEVAIEATKTVEAMPAPAICHVEPLWAVCTGEPMCTLLGDCERDWRRSVIISAARRAVRLARAGA